MDQVERLPDDDFSTIDGSSGKIEHNEKFIIPLKWERKFHYQARKAFNEIMEQEIFEAETRNEEGFHIIQWKSNNFQVIR